MPQFINPRDRFWLKTPTISSLRAWTLAESREAVDALDVGAEARITVDGAVPILGLDQHQSATILLLADGSAGRPVNRYEVESSI